MRPTLRHLLLWGNQVFDVVRALFANNEPGAWYDASDLTDAKLAFRRNLLTWTEDFSNAAWRTNESAVSAPNIEGPFGAFTATSILENTATAEHSLYQTITPGPGSSVCSFYIKAAGRTTARIRAESPKQITLAATFSLVGAGSVVDGSNATITLIGNGWYRCTAASASTSAGTSGYFLIQPLYDSTTASYAGDATKGIYIFAGQVEKGTTATTYQKITDYNTEFLAAFPSHALYQDSAGTLAVKALEDPVGLVLDKKGGLVVSSVEKVVNGSFDSDTVWNKAAGWSISGGTAIYSGAGAANLTQTGIVNSGVTYLVTLDVASITGAFTIRVGDGSFTTACSFTPIVGVQTARLTSNGPNVVIRSDGGTAIVVNSISVREIPGSHLIQPTSGNRPTWTRRVNLLTKTEDFSDAAWSKGNLTFSDSGIASPTGSNYTKALATATTATNFYQSITATATSVTVTLYIKKGSSATAGNKFGIYNITTSTLINRAVINYDTGVVTSSVGSATLTTIGAGEYRIVIPQSSGISVGNTLFIYAGQMGDSATAGDYHLVTSAQLEYGSTATRYQRVNTATDYEYLGFPSKIFHGAVNTNKFLYTASTMDLSATDKVTVFAGVQKLSDAAASMLAETSIAADSGASNGAFYITDPIGVSAKWRINVRGVGGVNQNDYGPYTAPISQVFSAALSTSAASSSAAIKARFNGASATGTVVQTNSTTGNLGNYTLYVGARAGTSLWFNGGWTQQIIRGALTSDAQVAQAEKFIANKTGVSI